MVLQRNQISVSNFLSNGALFGLTIVCAVLGVLTNHSDNDSKYTPEKQTLHTHQVLSSHNSAMHKCEQTGQCSEAFQIALNSLWLAIRFSVLNMQRISFIMFMVSFILLCVWLEPLRTLTTMVFPHSDGKLSNVFCPKSHKPKVKQTKRQKLTHSANSVESKISS